MGIDSGNNVVVNDINALVLANSTISGTLDVTTSGDISGLGAVVVAGKATFTAGAANDILLLNALNNFNSVGIVSGQDVALTDRNAIDLAASTISGTLDVTSDGAITDSGALKVAGAATFEAGTANNITLDAANDFNSVGIDSGNDVVINDTNTLFLNASTTAGDLTVTAAGQVTDSGKLAIGGDVSVSLSASGVVFLDELATSGLVLLTTTNGGATIVNSGSFSFGGNVVGLYSLKATSGGITDGAAVSATGGYILQAPGDSAISRALAGAGGLTFNGAGKLTLSGANTYTGDTVVNDGTVSLAGSLAGSTVKVMGGTFRGSGTIGGLASTSGTVRPGNSPGQFTSASAASLGAGATYTVEIDGATPVTGYSQLVVPGATLGGTLALVTSTPSFDPQIGTRFTIIDNTGSKRLAGTFKGLPEGGTIALGSQTYTITYKGGTGNNDVQLIRTRSIPTPSGPVITQPFSLEPGVIVSATNGTPAQVQLGILNGGLNGGVTRRIVPFAGYTGVLSVNALDRSGDGVADTLVVAKATPGSLSTVMLIDAATGRLVMQFNAFGGSFRGGARVTSGLATINGAPRTVIAVAAGPGSTPTVKVYDAISGALVKSFNAFGANYRAGVDVAMTSQTATQPGVLTVVSLVNSYVRVFDLNNTGSPLASFRAFTQQPMPANSIAVGDVNGDGSNEIVVGVGNLNLPAIRVYSMAGQQLGQFTPFPLEYTGGVGVAVTDYDRDGVLDIVAVAQSAARGRVRIFRAAGSPVLGNFRLAAVLTLASAGSNGVIEVQQPSA